MLTSEKEMVQKEQRRQKQQANKSNSPPKRLRVWSPLRRRFLTGNLKLVAVVRIRPYEVELGKPVGKHGSAQVGMKSSRMESTMDSLGVEMERSSENQAVK